MQANCYKSQIKKDLRLNRLRLLSANWKMMSSLDLVNRFYQMTEMERTTFNLGLSLEEATDFSEKLNEGYKQRLSEINGRCENPKRWPMRYSSRLSVANPSFYF